MFVMLKSSLNFIIQLPLPVFVITFICQSEICAGVGHAHALRIISLPEMQQTTRLYGKNKIALAQPRNVTRSLFI